MIKKIISISLMFQWAAYALPAFSTDSKTSTAPTGMSLVTAGEYRPLYLSKDSPVEKVDSFYIDQTPVTNEEFYQFVEKNPHWIKTQVPSIFAEDKYLSHWLITFNDWQPKPKQLQSPVTLVSWFAAQAYCQAKHKRLPKVAEWEYVARASETQSNGSEEASYNQTILNWYGRPSKDELPSIKQNKPNYWGVYDLHGLIWEWTEDFNSTLVSGESRADSTIDSALFCGAGAAGAADPKDYAAFMRFGFRSSLQAKFTLGNLGFRCALDKE